MISFLLLKCVFKNKTNIVKQILKLLNTFYFHYNSENLGANILNGHKKTFYIIRKKENNDNYILYNIIFRFYNNNSLIQHLFSNFL